METATRIMLIVVALVAFVVLAATFFRPEGGLLNQAAEKARWLERFVPNVSIGAKPVQGVHTTLPEEHERAIRTLADTIQSMVLGSRNYCFERYALQGYANHGGLPDLGDTTITLSENSLLVSRVVSEAGGKQVLALLSRELSSTVAGFKPCVIAGSEQVVRNFDTTFLTTGVRDRSNIPDAEILEPHYTEVSAITLSYAGKNQIDFGKGPKDLEDFGYLYSPGDGWVCFFPTVDGNTVCDGSNQGGLDDDCLGEDPGEDIAIPFKVQEGCLASCTGEQVACKQESPPFSRRYPTNGMVE